MNGKYPPGPRDGLFGITFHRPLQADPLGFVSKVAREYGDFAFLRVGWVRLYLVNRPELIREVLATRTKSFRKLGKQMRALRKIEGDGLVVSDGDIWSRHRPVVQGSFHARHFGRHARTIVDTTLRRLESWKPDEPFDLSAEMNELAMEIIARVVFDVDLAEQVARLRNFVHVFRGAMQREMSAPIPLPDWIPLPGKIRQRRALKAVDDLIWEMIRERRASGVFKNDMLGQMLAANPVVHPNSPLSDAEIRDEAATLFVAGHDTTSAALAWFWYCLASNPDVEAKVMREIDTVVGERPPTDQDVPRLKYLDMVVKESMRLFPAAGFLFGRETVEDVELGGCTLKRGSWVFMSPFVVHRDARNYPNPEVFDPERFAPGRIDEIAPYSYIPFGGGPRICIGNSLATMQIILMATTILQRYRVVLDQGPPELELEIVLRPRGGLRMRAEPRSGRGRLGAAA